MGGSYIDIIYVCIVDDSGNWGRGGLFSAIVGRSPLPEEQYTLAGKMKGMSSHIFIKVISLKGKQL